MVARRTRTGLLAVHWLLIAGCGSESAPPDSASAGTTSVVAGAAGSSANAAGAAGAPDSAGQGGAASGGSSGSASGGTAGTLASAGSAGAERGGSSGQSGAGAGGSPGTVLDPAQPPGKNFDLTRWVLQLPLADGDSVKQISDLGSYTSEFFYTAPDGAMAFWCPVTGAHTPNTKYPRSELREKPVGGDWAITGKHRLSATFKVTKNLASKGTIIGQIHGNATGGTSEVLKLEWTSENAIVASVEDNDAPATQIDKPLGNYALGELLSYDITLENGSLKVTVTGAKGSKSITSPYTASSWTKDKYYFKLGNYVQLNTGASSDGARVQFYAVNVEHGQ